MAPNARSAQMILMRRNIRVDSGQERHALPVDSAKENGEIRPGIQHQLNASRTYLMDQFDVEGVMAIS